MSDEWKDFSRRSEVKPSWDIRDITYYPLDQRKVVIDRWVKDHLNCKLKLGHRWTHHWDEEIRMWIWKCSKCEATRMNQTTGNEIWVNKDGTVEALIMTHELVKPVKDLVLHVPGFRITSLFFG